MFIRAREKDVISTVDILSNNRIGEVNKLTSADWKKKKSLSQ